MDRKNAERWDGVAVDFQRTYGLGPSEYSRKLLSFWQERGMIFPSCRVLDIGCGVGKYGARLAALGCDVTLTDISPEMIRLAEGNMAASESPWRTFVCDFDAVTGRESVFQGGFDFSLSTMSPAVHDAATVLKMSRMTHGCCFIARFSSWHQPDRDRLLERLGIPAEKAGGSLAGDCEEIINAVKDAGFTPEIKYVDYCWCDRRTPQETADYLLRRHPALAETGREKILRAAESLCDGDGLFTDRVDTSVAWVFWRTE